MRVEVSFLRGVIARRIFWVLLMAATLPLLVFAALAHGSLAERLDEAVRAQLQEGARDAGLRVQDRLLSAQTALAALAGSDRGDRHPPGGAAHANHTGHGAHDLLRLAPREIFSGVVRIGIDDGRIEGATEVATAWQAVAAEARGGASPRRLWWTPSRAGTPGRVIIGLRDGRRWWLGELTHEFLWAELRDHDSSLATCVADEHGRPLLCGAMPAEAAPERRSESWTLALVNEFGSESWLLTRSVARSRLPYAEVPVGAVTWKAAAFSLLLVLVLSVVLIRRTTGPLEQLLAGTQRLAARDWSARVDVNSRDEFGRLADSFNEMAARIDHQMRALQVQAQIDREMLRGADLRRMLGHVSARMGELLPGLHTGLLVAPLEPGGRWQRPASRAWAAAAVAVDPELLRRVETGGVTLDGRAARHAARLLDLQGGTPLPARLVPARAEGRIVALLLAVGELPRDEDLLRELDELADRLAVLLVAAARERELRERAVHDSLTGLLNRAGLIEALEQRLARADTRFVLAFIDLDGFKAVNDSCGHPVGDALLCEVTALLQSRVGHNATLARLGGDEFVLLLPGDDAAAEQLARELCERIAEPFVLHGHTLRIGASMGLVHAATGDDRVELMRRADLAMYAAKAAGRARHAWYQAAMDERAAARAWLLAELPLALRHDQLCLHYQPRVRAGSGTLASVEALVRWQHPVRGLIAPGQFVPLAEETGQVEALGRWVLEAACRQLQAWRAGGVRVPRVSVNVSAPQLAAPGFADEVLHTLHQHGLKPSDLEIEITESLFAGDPVEVSGRLEPLRAAGVLVALDDFGTGFSSLSSLYRLPVDVLKIDRSFVTDLGRRAAADAVARSVVALGRALGKHVVAEGVETDAQHQHLLALGCDELQGFLFARPLPALELQRWLQGVAEPVA